MSLAKFRKIIKGNKPLPKPVDQNSDQDEKKSK